MNFLKDVEQVININYKSLSKQSPVESVSIFRSNGNILTQQFLSEKIEKIYTATSNSQPKVTNKTTKDEWKTVVDKTVPHQITNYLYAFPSYLIVNSEEWNESIKNSALKLYMEHSNFKTIKHSSGQYVISNEKKPHQDLKDFIKSDINKNIEVKVSVEYVGYGYKEY